MVYKYIGQLAKSRYYNKTHGIRFDQLANDVGWMQKIGSAYAEALANRNIRLGKRVIKGLKTTLNKRIMKGRSKVKKSAGQSGTPKLKIMRRLVKRGGASNSKSKGFVARGTSKKQKLDYYGKAGIVMAQEYGSVLSDTGAGPFMQSVNIGHANFTVHSLYAAVSFAFAKMVASKLKRQMIDVNDLIELASQGDLSLVLYYRKNTFSVTTLASYTIVAGGSRWCDVAKWFYDLMQSTFTPTTELVSLRCTDSVREATPVADAYGILLFDLDMTKCRISLYSKSALKFQNRTINSANNDEADDVDNVPLYGKSYEGSGNYAIYKISRQEHASITMGNTVIASDPIFGTNKVKFPVGEYKYYGSTTVPGGGDSLSEPPVQSQFSHVKRVGKIHLDPAEIKTSVLVFEKSYNINTLIRSAVRVSQDANDISQRQDHPFGSYRFFILEKMIQAVTSTDVNGIKLAFECDCKIGAVCTAPVATTSCYILDQQPL